MTYENAVTVETRHAQEAHGRYPAYLFGSLLLVAGCLTVFLFGRTSHLTCQRVGPENARCQFEETLLGRPMRTATLDQVNGARLATRDAPDEEITYEVRLESPEGELTLDLPNSSFEGKDRIASQVTAFVQGRKEADLAVRQRGLVGWLLGSLFFLSGLVVLLQAQDRSTQVRDDQGR
jgi:hypothetical protein